MTSQPLVSVLTPAYRCESFLEAMILSIQAQTYPNWELIIVDDGSDDHTRVIALGAAQSDSRIRAFPRPHLGYARAFNFALSEARGQIIARQDADDWSEPTRLWEQVAKLQQGFCEIISCSMVRIRQDGTRVTRACQAMNPEKYVTCTVPDGPCGSSIVTWKWVYDLVGGFNPAMEASADSDWNFRTLAVRQPRIRWGFIAKDLYCYREHPAQMTKTRGQEGLQIFHHGQKLYRAHILANLAGEARDA